MDQILFKENKTAGIVAHKQEDAKKFFRDKVKFAWDNLPPLLKEFLGPPDTDTAGELSFPNGSKIFVSTSTRSGTCQYLHISEFGKLCASFPGKAEEIVTGSINTIEKGCIVTIESTAEGKSGYFYEFCQQAERAAKEKRKLTPLEFKFFFFPWWMEPNYSLEATFAITTEENEYFKQLAAHHGIVLSMAQKRWYVMKRRINKDKMLSEYPSTAEEAFLASIEGAYYSGQMAKVYEQKRVRPVPYDARLPVDTWWDLGMNDSNVVIFTQAVGPEIRIIDYYENSGEGLAHYVGILKEKGYVYGRHTFPHDVEIKELGTGVSRRQTLIDLGLQNVRTVERTKDILDDIEAVRKLFTRFYFDEEKTDLLIQALNQYRKEWDEKLGDYKNTPRHDKWSHAADAMRTLARGWTDHYMPQTADGKERIKEENFF